jgi:hypothetical protein
MADEVLSGLAVSRWFGARNREVEKALRQSVGDQSRDLVRYAKKLSSGRFSAKTLRQMGHPYAKRHGRSSASGRFQKHAAGIPYGDPGIINRQTDDFKDGWRVTRARLSEGKDEIDGGITNISSHAKFLFSPGGTKRMIARPILRKLEEYHKQRWDKKVRASLARVWKDNDG